MAVTLHTNHGDLKIELACDLVPKIAFNFLALAASGAYNGTLFHRNVAGFLVQGGDPTKTGKGGECIWGGKMADQFHPRLRHSGRGIVAMATSKPDSIGSQFYITYAAQPQLDNVCSIVGRVLHHGTMPVLDDLEGVPVKGKKFRPVDDIIIRHVSIQANPFAEQRLPVESFR